MTYNVERAGTNSSRWRNLLLAFVVAVAVDIGLYSYDVLESHSLQHIYLVWNLFLAVIPIFLARRLVMSLRRKLWSDWEPIGWTLLWLLFLPNSFYMISDYIHLADASANRVLFLAVMFTAFIYLGALLGFASLYLVHRQLLRRVSKRWSGVIVGAILVICSFAVYVGRDLRWNSWDVLFNPGGLLFDVSDRFLHPAAYPTMLLTVASFSVLLASLYAILWQTAKRLTDGR